MSGKQEPIDPSSDDVFFDGPLALLFPNVTETATSIHRFLSYLVITIVIIHILAIILYKVKGIHLTKTLDGDLKLGPDAEWLNNDDEMFPRPGRPSDKFVSPYPNIQAATAANGGAYPPDMSVLAKARAGGADYLYSLLLGYEEAPEGFELDDGVYYNKYMYGNKIKMANQLSDGLIEYGDGTEATVEQMSKDVTTFLMWTAEPHLEARHQMGFKAIVYLIILTILVYYSMKRIWSRIETEV